MSAQQRSEGRIALVTGGARGIGAAIARRLVQDGARVIIGDINEEGAAATAAAIGDHAESLRLDVLQLESWENAISTIEQRHGGLDILVNNAGGIADGPIEQASEEVHRRVLDLNLTSVWLGCKAALPALRDRGAAAIVNISSIDGLVGISGLSTYVAAKFGVTGMTRALAMEFGPHGIRVNSVHPGITNSENVTKIPTLYGEDSIPWQRLQNAIDDQPLKRMGDVGDIANAVAFLASDEAAYCTGTQLVVDGGQLAGPARRPSY